MLQHLHIKSFALIDEMNVDFAPGFSVITGETGAGKSIILGALGLLMGNRADTKAVKEGASKCIIEGIFAINSLEMRSFFDRNELEYDDECIVRREINVTGKSRAFINDSPVSLNILKELGTHLIDIHSQHQNLLLEKSNFQLAVIDTLASSHPIILEYQKHFREYFDAKRKMEQMIKEIEENRMKTDFLKFQYSEISALALSEGEEQELQQQLEMMQHSEDIKHALITSANALDDEEGGAVTNIYHALNGLQRISNLLPKVSEMATRLDEAYEEIRDISAEIASLCESVDFDPREMESKTERLDAIYTLERKYHCADGDSLLELQANIQKSLEDIDNADNAVADLQLLMNDALAEAQKQARLLTACRENASATVQEQMQNYLKQLGLLNVRFHIQITPKALSEDGADDVKYLFSANPGTPLRPMAEIASGGEMARVMLSLKALLCGAIKLPTIIFDEIDTGVSGRVAEQMAEIMRQMGQADRQVISITHLPQIAAYGHNHYKVYKSQMSHSTESNMHLLSHEERVTEIAQMLSGSTITDAALSNARELLKSV